MSDAAVRALWARICYSRLQGQENSSDVNEKSKEEFPIALLFCDNKAALTLTHGLKSTSAIRHIRTSFHHIVDEVRQGTLCTNWVPGKDMLADGLTKPLGRIQFEDKRRRIGVRDVEKWIDQKT
ncbi:putative tir-nbs-lrr type disease resistance protein [Erysiphe necator]|uniref:Putative tir-nbs-lrr type disease resistance protein n=1 Tax=Uncinula necator TaxID=52586 RepID=A0A0B1P5D4_UNCNE|nr:putative tir-nbs-lrr type disease resistance protein [Erysiphe necator]